MMSHLDWIKVGGATRGTPRRLPTRRGRLFAIGLMGCMALIQAGCQSGPFGNGGCSTCGGFFARTTNRILHRDKGCCGSTGGLRGRRSNTGRRASSSRARFPRIRPVGRSGTAPSNVTAPTPDYPSHLESDTECQAGSDTRRHRVRPAIGLRGPSQQLLLHPAPWNCNGHAIESERVEHDRPRRPEPTRGRRRLRESSGGAPRARWTTTSSTICPRWGYPAR